MACRLALLLHVVFIASPATALNLRQAAQDTVVPINLPTLKAHFAAKHKIVRDIGVKWTGMDSVVEEFWNMACMAKHGPDVNGRAQEVMDQALKDAQGSGKAISNKFEVEHRKVQVHQMRDLGKACNIIDADGQRTCRKGCAQLWKGAMGRDRVTCDDACVRQYKNFKTSCLRKVEDLNTTYTLKLQKSHGIRNCYDNHCGSMPTVWTKESPKLMVATVADICSTSNTKNNGNAGRCSKKVIGGKCDRSWNLEKVKWMDKLSFQCRGKDEAANTTLGKATVMALAKCMKNTTAVADAASHKCQKATQCTISYSKCTAKVNKMKANKVKAQKFCDKRESVCRTKAIKECGPIHVRALNAGGHKCKDEAQVRFDRCKAKALAKTQVAEKQKCVYAQIIRSQRGATDSAYKVDFVANVTQRTKQKHAFFLKNAKSKSTIDWDSAQSACATTCPKACNVQGMMKCIFNFGKLDPSSGFCKDMWLLMHTANEIDPYNGHPIFR